jgi:hypothetical protein
MGTHRKYTKEILELIIIQCNTWHEVCLKLGLKPLSGSQAHIKKITDKFNLNYSHFRGAGWRTKYPEKIIYVPIEDYLTNKRYCSSHKLKLKLFKAKLKEKKCERCGIIEWLGGPAPLELDHINGDHFDNMLENLKILCPNCHAIKDK